MTTSQAYLLLHDTVSDIQQVDVPPISANTEWHTLFTPHYAVLAPSHERLWLLVYLDHGVQWGYYDGKATMFAPDAGSVTPEYAQAARLFGERGEYYLWRATPTTYHARLRLDAESKIVPPHTDEPYTLDTNLGDKPSTADEWQVLWGDMIARNTNGWTTLQEGSRGISLTLPILLTKKGQKPEPEKDDRLPLRLLVRHYLTYTADGLCTYSDSRMVAFADNLRNHF